MMELFTRLKKSTLRAKDRISRQDFGLLKLPDRESSIDAIRSAAMSRVKDLRTRKGGSGRAASRANDVAAILTAAYRLLDPRRRQRVSERVQLSLPMWESQPVHSPLPALVPPRADSVQAADAFELDTDPTLDELRQILSIVRAVDATPVAPGAGAS